jgi:hypothetical protein
LRIPSPIGVRIYLKEHPLTRIFPAVSTCSYPVVMLPSCREPSLRKPLPPPHRWKILPGAGTIVISALAAYHNSLAGPFLFDDHFSIEDSLTIRHLWPIWKVLSSYALILVAVVLPSCLNSTTGRPWALLVPGSS